MKKVSGKKERDAAEAEKEREAQKKKDKGKENASDNAESTDVFGDQENEDVIF